MWTDPHLPACTYSRTMDFAHLTRCAHFFSLSAVTTQYHYYRHLKDRGQVSLHREWVGVGATAEPGEAMSNAPDTDEYRAASVAGFLG